MFRIILFSMLVCTNAYGIYGKTVSANQVAGLSDIVPLVVEIQKFKNGSYQTSCTGTKLSRFEVLTAAHCFGDEKFDLRISVGEQLFWPASVKIASDYVYEEVLHPHFQYVYDLNIENDIAIVTLQANTVGSGETDTSKLLMERSGKIVKSSSFLFSGYGQTGNIFGMGEGEGELRFSAFTQAADSSKSRIYFQDSSTGSCQGDSGGPVWMKLGQTWKQVGIVSQGDCNTFSWVERISMERLDQVKFEVIWAKSDKGIRNSNSLLVTTINNQ